MTVNIQTICYEEYGVNAIIAHPTTVLWAAEKITDHDFARSEIKRINELRTKYGKPLVHVPYDHYLF